MGLGTIYSDAKALWHPERIAALQRGERIVPAQVHLVISDLCNHDCSFCAYRMSGYESNQLFADEKGNNNPNRRIPTHKAMEIIDSCASMGVQAVQFTGGGEPTVHKAHMSIFAHALQRGLACALVTNGQTLADGWDQVLPRFRWVRFSLDAGTAESHSMIRWIKDTVFAKVLGNMAKMAEMDAPVGASFVVTHDNYDEIHQAALVSRDHGAHSLRVAGIFSPDGSDYYTDDEVKVINEQIALAKEEFQVFDLFSKRVTGAGEQPDYNRCVYQEFTSYIGGDLNVYRCCNTAYNKRGLIGSLKDQSFEKLWSDFAPAEFNAKGCRVCMYNDKNRLLNMAAVDEPGDPEFV